MALATFPYLATMVPHANSNVEYAITRLELGCRRAHRPRMQCSGCLHTASGSTIFRAGSLTIAHKARCRHCPWPGPQQVHKCWPLVPQKVCLPNLEKLAESDGLAASGNACRCAALHGACASTAKLMQMAVGAAQTVSSPPKMPPKLL